jgi:hypothetical protein
MKVLELKKGGPKNKQSLKTISLQVDIDIYHLRSWRRDTMLSLLGSTTFMESRAQSEARLANGLYNVIRNALPWCSEKYFVDSIRTKIIKPAIELAQKVCKQQSHILLELRK